MTSGTPTASRGLTRAHVAAPKRVTATKIGVRYRVPTPEQVESTEILAQLYLAQLGIWDRLFETDADQARRRRRNQILYSADWGTHDR